MAWTRLTRAAILLALWSLLFVGLPEASGQFWSAPVRDAQRRFQKDAVSWKDLREQFIVMQKKDYSCGAACLATIVRYYWGDEVDEDMFLGAIEEILTHEELKDRIKNGLSMTDLRRAAVHQGYLAVMGKRKLSDLTELKAPVIVRIVANKHEHFVVLRGLANDRVYLADPIRGHLRIPICQFARQWDTRTVLAVAKPGSQVPESSPLLVGKPLVVQPELQSARRTLQIETLPRMAPILVH